MKHDIIETVLNELLQEEKILGKKLEELHEYIKSFKEQLSAIQINVPTINTLPIEIKLAEHLSKMQGELNGLKHFIAGERKKQRFQDILMQWIGWIFFAASVVVLLLT